VSNIDTHSLMNELHIKRDEILKLNDSHLSLKFRIKDDDKSEMKLKNYLKGLTNYNTSNNDSISKLS
jgi:hypothetical protein